jgi:dolichol-phosphate mannosyltransferase
MKALVAIPVYNEERHLAHVLDEVRPYCANILVINDGSTDGTGELLSLQKPAGLSVVTHPRNQGYGAALISAFEFFKTSDFDVLVTMDCDGQHEPNRIPVLLEALDSQTDIVSGSRYLREFRRLSLPTPQDRRQINQIVTSELNDALGVRITDAFCGFKAYRKNAVARLRITERGWGMPLQLWVQAAQLELRIREVGVPRLYLDPNRAFGGMLNDASQRLAYYRRVIADAVAEETAACRRNTCHA